MKPFIHVPRYSLGTADGHCWVITKSGEYCEEHIDSCVMLNGSMMTMDAFNRVSARAFVALQKVASEKCPKSYQIVWINLPSINLSQMHRFHVNVEGSVAFVPESEVTLGQVWWEDRFEKDDSL